METKSTTMWLFAQTHLWSAMICTSPTSRFKSMNLIFKKKAQAQFKTKFYSIGVQRLQNILDTHCAWLVSPAASPGCCPRLVLPTEAYVQAGRWPQYLTNLDFNCAVAIFVTFFVCIVSASDSTIFLQKYPGYNCCFVVSFFVLTDKFATSLPK